MRKITWILGLIVVLVLIGFGFYIQSNYNYDAGGGGNSNKNQTNYPESVSELDFDYKIKDFVFGEMHEIDQLLIEEEKSFITTLEFQGYAKIIPGTEDYGLLLIAKTPNEQEVESLQYRLSLENFSQNNCIVTLGEQETENLINNNLDDWTYFEDFRDNLAITRISLTIPDGTEPCEQKIFIQLKKEGSDNMIGQSLILIQIYQPEVVSE